MLKRSSLALVAAVVTLATSAGQSFAQTGQDLGPAKVMIGDQFGFCATQTLQVPINLSTTVTTTTVVTETIFTTTFPPTTTSTSTTSLFTLFQTLEVCNPYAGRVAFKISENESPEAQTRVYIGYSYVDGVRGVGNSIAPTSRFSSSFSTDTVQTSEVESTRTDTTITTAVNSTGFTVGTPRVSRHAEIFGAEYAFLDGGPRSACACRSSSRTAMGPSTRTTSAT